MGIDEPEHIDIDKILEELDQAGNLDSDNIEDGVLQLHECLRTCGADPEDPTSYRAIIAVAGILGSFPIFAWGSVTEEMVRVSFRALRDLRNRGGA